MPRPKPPEELITVTYRMTRKQIRKVTEMGGAPWLRDLIGKTNASKNGRCPVANIVDKRKRNEDIQASQLTSDELAKKYKLSRQQVNYIRRHGKSNTEH